MLYQAGVVPVIPTLRNGIQAESGQEGERGLWAGM